MGQTVVEKIAQQHMAAGPERPLRAGDFLTVRPRHVMTHDNTAPAMRKFAALGAQRIREPTQPVFVLDHDIQNRGEANRAKYRSIERFAAEQGVDFHPAGSGIGHQIVVERLYAVPGAFVVAADSHANTYGGIGALGTPVVRSDAAAIWATGTFWWQVPPSIRVELEGALPPGATGKDAILALCGLYSSGEVLNAAIEFSGPGVASLSVDERLTMANMTTEWGALSGWFPVDATTLAWIDRRRLALAENGRTTTVTDARMRSWRARPPAPDRDAVYTATIRLDLAQVDPHVAGPDTVHVATPLREIEGRRIPVHKAYVVSCVNSRAADLAAAAAVLAGRSVAAGVELYVAAASRDVEEQARREGSWQLLLDAGARPLPPGCGPCIGLGAGLLAPGEIGISATNRNFRGRMGSRDARCYLAAPAVVAASAAAGYIRGPQPSEGRRLLRRFENSPGAAGSVALEPEIVPGFPERLQGRAVCLLRDHLDKDGIYDKNHTYRDDLAPEAMAVVVFENHDPLLAARLRPGDILIGGRNFGCGSSREQAVTALQAAGIAAIVAASFSRTFLRNALNHGFCCVECSGPVDRARHKRPEPAGSAPATCIPGDSVEIDFVRGAIEFAGGTFAFRPPDPVFQRLIVDGGLERSVRRELERT